MGFIAPMFSGFSCCSSAQPPGDHQSEEAKTWAVAATVVAVAFAVVAVVVVVILGRSELMSSFN